LSREVYKKNAHVEKVTSN